MAHRSPSTTTKVSAVFTGSFQYPSGTRPRVASRPTTPDPGATRRSAESKTTVSGRTANSIEEPAPNPTPCTGASDEPIASANPSTVGMAASRRALTSAERMLPPEPSSRTEDVSHAADSRASARGRPLVSPTSVSMHTRSAATRSKTTDMSMVRPT